MRLYDLKEYVRTLVHSYFQNATITWANEVSIKKKPPQITLQLSNIRRTTHPIDEDQNSGEIIRYYPSTALLTINSFIIGKGAANESPDNTAVADLNEFLNYIDSPEMVDVLFQVGLSFSIASPVQDIPRLLGTTHYEYRAMVEFQIDFTQELAGSYSLGHPASEKAFDTETETWVESIPVREEDWEPTASGGGSYEMENVPLMIFDVVELKENKEE